MHLDALTRLRLAFLALGVLVFAPLAWLLSSVEARLDAQRRLRHEVVADRIFDELERELTSVLAQGSLQAPLPRGQRPPVESWPPFVIGYIKRAGSDEQLFTRNGSGPGDEARLRLALDGVLKKVGSAALPSRAAGGPPAQALPLDAELGPGAGSPQAVNASSPNLVEPAPLPPAKIKAGEASQSDVLKSLNRAHEQRQDYRYR